MLQLANFFTGSRSPLPTCDGHHPILVAQHWSMSVGDVDPSQSRFDEFHVMLGVEQLKGEVVYRT